MRMVTHSIKEKYNKAMRKTEKKKRRGREYKDLSGYTASEKVRLETDIRAEKENRFKRKDFSIN